MSTQLVLAALIGANLRYGDVQEWLDESTPVFVPPLTAAEQAILDDLKTMAHFGVSLTLAEWQSVKPDAALLRTYNGIASPTLAQTIAATKAQNRILATIIRS